VGVWFFVSAAIETVAYFTESRAWDLVAFGFLVVGTAAAVLWVKATWLPPPNYRNFVAEVETLRSNGDMPATVGLLAKYRNSLSPILNHRPFWQNRT